MAEHSALLERAAKALVDAVKAEQEARAGFVYGMYRESAVERIVVAAQRVAGCLRDVEAALAGKSAEATP